MVDAGVFYLESAPPLVVNNVVVGTVVHTFADADATEETVRWDRSCVKGSNNNLFVDIPDRTVDMEGTKEALNGEDTVVMFDMSTYENTDDGMFVDSWEHCLDDETEYSVVFEEKYDDTIGSVPCGLNLVRSDEDQPVSELKTATMEQSEH